jgi:hypothetical protein
MPPPAATAGDLGAEESPARPIYVEPEIKDLWIEDEADNEIAEGKLNPASPIHGLDLQIGWKGSLGADLYSVALVLPGWLRRECDDHGFEWGRHFILVDEVVPDLTHRKLAAFLDAFCRRCAGSPEAAREKLAELGKWEFEDIGSGMPGRPRWHIRARLLDLSSPDVDLATFVSAPGRGFGIRIRARVGAEGGIEAGSDSAVFEFLLCTPAWLAKERDLSEMLLCSGIAFMQHFDLDILRRQVQEACAELKGYTAEEAIGKMRRYATRVTA